MDFIYWGLQLTLSICILAAFAPSISVVDFVVVLTIIVIGALAWIASNGS